MAKSTDKVLVNCSRCGGLGTIARFGHTWQGACFGCKGKGKVSVAKTSKDRPHYQVTVGGRDMGIQTATAARNSAWLAANTWHLPCEVVDTDTGATLSQEQLATL